MGVLATFPLDQPASSLHGMGKKLARPLKRLGVTTIRDLLAYAPVRHEDLRHVTDIGSVTDGPVVVRGRIESIANRRAPRARMLLTEAAVADATGMLRCVWFQQAFLAHAFPAGTRVVLSGVVTSDRYGRTLRSPVIERDTDANLHVGRLVPIYALTAGITNKQLRFLVHAALPFARELPEVLLDAIRAREGLLTRADAVHAVHFPSDERTLARARERLLFDDLVAYLLRVRASRAELDVARAPRICVDAARVQRVTRALPFALTQAQEHAIRDVLADMSAAPTPLLRQSFAGQAPRPPSRREGVDGGVRPMQRLLNGDVGSGKTAVAAIAAAIVAECGLQAAYLAPTEVLAVQQANVLTSWLQPLGITVACWTGSTFRVGGEEVSRAEVRRAVASGVARVVVGTHAIITGTATFADLALAIVDEQHRFGVAQRAALRQKARQHGGVLPSQRGSDAPDASPEYCPHLLSMTATPIPRTLQLALLGDLAVSVLDERPHARAPVTTHVIGPADRLAMTRAVKAELSAGHQAFIVCGKIEDDEGGERATATEAYERAQQAFAPRRVGLLHGRMKPAEQRATMAAFAAREVEVLIATTVIEVGVDQPNATAMIIEDAERFGLSQLHQLRGRVGRGRAPGVCYLATRIDAPQVRAHLRRVAETTDGFALAEFDLARRGPGAIFGTMQSGRAAFPIWEMDPRVLERARVVAEELAAQGVTAEGAHLE